MAEKCRLSTFRRFGVLAFWAQSQKGRGPNLEKMRGPREWGPEGLEPEGWRLERWGPPGLHTTAQEPKHGHLRVPALQTPKFHENTQILRSWVRRRWVRRSGVPAFRRFFQSGPPPVFLKQTRTQLFSSSSHSCHPCQSCRPCQRCRSCHCWGSPPGCRE